MLMAFTYRMTPDLLYDIQRDLPEAEFFVDKELKMYDEFVARLRSGEKKTSSRYIGGNFIRIPKSNVLPIIETSRTDKKHWRNIGEVTIDKVVIQRFDEMQGADQRALQNIYQSIHGDIKPDEWVTTYHISSARLEKPRGRLAKWAEGALLSSGRPF